MQFSAESYIKHYTNLLTYTCVFLIYLDIPSKYSTHLDYGKQWGRHFMCSEH